MSKWRMPMLTIQTFESPVVGRVLMYTPSRPTDTTAIAYGTDLLQAFCVSNIYKIDDSTCTANKASHQTAKVTHFIYDTVNSCSTDTSPSTCASQDCMRGVEPMYMC